MSCGCNKTQGGGGKSYKHRHTRSCSRRQSGGMFEWLTGPVEKKPNTLPSYQSQAQSQPSQSQPSQSQPSQSQYLQAQSQPSQSQYLQAQPAYTSAQPAYIGGRRGRKTRRAKKSRKNKKSRKYRR